MKKMERSMPVYCEKCGNFLRPGDRYCGHCGRKLGKKNTGKKGWQLLAVLGITLCLAAWVISNRNVSACPEASGAQKGPISEDQGFPEQPKDTDVLEDSDYKDGTPRRRVRDYSDTVYVTDYRSNGLLLRETTLYYSGGTYSAIRVVNYDAHGNKTDTTETLATGELWLYTYCENTYDAQGRPLVLAEYNRCDHPLYILEYTYHTDGSWTQVGTEYRGYVYEYDAEYNPQGTTAPFSRSTTTFNAQGEPVDQYIEELG